MTLDELGVDVGQLQAICARYGIARLELFGSAARGDLSPGSDIDLLYELRPGARLGWEIETLADELSHVFGRPVDLVSKRALHRRLRDAVISEAQLVYAA